MKKIYGVLTLIFTLILVSCFEDEGNYSYHPIDEIAIEGLGDIHQHYAYVKDILKITPTIQTNYKDLKYVWLLWNAEGGSDMDTIGENRNLAYEVNLKPGRYTVMLKATSGTNGYSVAQTTKLEVATQFGRGFYILKENNEGNSELDFSPDGKKVVENLLRTSGAGALSGKPLCMGPVYLHGYIDEQTDKTTSCNAVFVTTASNQIAFYNTEDLSMTQGNANIVYGGLTGSEEPYLAFTTSYTNYFLTGSGFYSEGHEMKEYGSKASSAFAKSAGGGNGGSCFIAMITAEVWGMPVDAYLYWNTQAQRIELFAGSYSSYLDPYNEGNYSTAGMECLMCGAVGSSNKCYFLLKDARERKYLYECDASTLSTVARIEISASSGLDKAVCYATNAKTAGYLYYVTDNKLYAYHLAERKEGTAPLALNGITGNEKIVHLSYQWIDVAEDKELGTNFTYLVVGTQEGDTYRVRMYDIVGGEPKELVHTIEGYGQFKSVAYISPRYNANDYTSPSSSSLPN